ncbi:hypothetical protein EKE94_07055 [Mesobaculum littorinae]|uniref:Cytochrome c domain-containing protein n=1 Tax=Mesobaculum littorinae TaxID=2486419 RepID=A0A438AIZ7_9RHOB|nr:cytochrome c [Mesobaculum littorinae]RVV98662.1 hypothetical protein EKE94_07055 [Mesobaculum littorinae]
MKTALVTTVFLGAASMAFAQSAELETDADTDTAQAAETGAEVGMKPQVAEMSEIADQASFGAAGYTSTDGEALYQSLCAGCHMPDGSGAVGAGAYPALRENQNLEFAAYPITLIVNGQSAMPAFGEFLNDEQVVAITTYLQTHLGNDYTPDATAEDVALSRPVDPADPNTAEHE